MKRLHPMGLTRGGRARAWLAAAVALGCRNTPPSASPELASAPVPPPALGISGCVESDELHAYVSALDAERRAASDAALAALGARRDVRQARFLDPAAASQLDQVALQGETRFAVVAQQAIGFEPELAVAKRGNQLHRIDERPRGHGVPVVACGVTPCPEPRLAGSEPARANVRVIGVELAPEESLGAPLVVAYDYWWAQVRYPKHARCAAPQVTAR